MVNPWENIKDAILAERINKGDSEAFAAAYDRYAPILLRHLTYRTPNRETAEDILSKVFLRAWEYVGKGKTISYLKQFFYTIANNALTDFYRRNAISDVLVEDFSALDRPDERESAAISIDRDLDRAVLAENLKKLRPEYRDILVMSYIDELRTKEIAKTLGISANAVYVRVHRALRSFKKILQDKP